MADDFDRELQVRLAEIESPHYADPAREDLPGRDLTLLVAFGGLLIVLMFLWSYPA
jgi:hypothetical protein